MAFFRLLQGEQQLAPATRRMVVTRQSGKPYVSKSQMPAVRWQGLAARCWWWLECPWVSGPVLAVAVFLRGIPYHV